MHINKFCRYCRFYNRKNRMCNQYRTGALHSADDAKPACFRFSQYLAKHPLYCKALMLFTWTDLVTLIELSVLAILTLLVLLIILAPAPIATAALLIFTIIIWSYMVLVICMFVWYYLICPIKDRIAQLDEFFKDLK